MFALKALSHEGVASALAKAEHYRLLKRTGRSGEHLPRYSRHRARNQQALICLVLAQSDQIARDSRSFHSALATVQKLQGSTSVPITAGIVWERRAKALDAERGRGTHHSVYEWVVKALDCFAQAERLRPAGNDDAVLRWNTCVRFLTQSSKPRAEGRRGSRADRFGVGEFVRHLGDHGGRGGGRSGPAQRVA